MKKGKIIQDIKTNTSIPVLTLHYSMYFSLLLYLEGLTVVNWWDQTFRGIGFLAEFFSPGNGTLKYSKRIFYHYFSLL